jgi:hypothetical protein
MTARTRARRVAVEVEPPADAAWRAVFRGELAEAEVEAHYGEPSWSALLYRSFDEQQEGERALARYNARHRQQQGR